MVYHLCETSAGWTGHYGKKPPAVFGSLIIIADRAAKSSTNCIFPKNLDFKTKSHSARKRVSGVARWD